MNPARLAVAALILLRDAFHDRARRADDEGRMEAAWTWHKAAEDVTAIIHYLGRRAT